MIEILILLKLYNKYQTYNCLISILNLYFTESSKYFEFNCKFYQKLH